jgi:hypothetical protein
VEGCPARGGEPTAAYRLEGFIGKEEAGKAWGGGIFHCGLSLARSSQGTGSCVLVPKLGNRTFESQTDGSSRTLLGVLKELGLMFWHWCWEIR